MSIAILPYHLKGVRHLADVPLDQLLWPLEPAIELEGRLGTVRDLTSDDHLVVAPGSRRLYYPGEKLACSLSLRITEPYAVHRRHYLAMYALWPRFYRIFSRCQRLASRLPNARALPLATTWIDDPESAEVTQAAVCKTKRMSLIASGKKKLPGHRLRHQLAAWIQQAGIDVDLLGRAYQPFEKKEAGLAPYQFSVIIENCREPAYFSEKLLDCFLCWSIPIYWGAPNVGQYFDLRGMIVCQNAKEVQAAITTLSSSDYERLRFYAEENRRQALTYINQERSIAEMIEAELNGKRVA